MEELERLDNALYASKYGRPIEGDYETIWKEIKENKQILKEAIQLTKDKFGQRDLVKGITICDSILRDYRNADLEIYQELVSLIYSNEQIARLVVDGYANGGCSYLLMTLWNHNLKLTEEQKSFAVNEAMNKIGTSRYQQAKELRRRELDSQGINDNDTVFVEFGGSIQPIGRRTATEYFVSIFSSLSDTQAHGTGEFDIRYSILRNPNWTDEEKAELIYAFYPDDEEYEEILEQWEWGIINDSADLLYELNKDDLYDYTYEDLVKFYKSRDTSDEIWNEIQFCKEMYKIRPPQWERGYQKNK